MGYSIKAGYPINLQVGQRLRQLRTQKGLSQQEVADHLEVCRSTYTKYETGASQMSYSTILILAKYLSVDFNTLLCYDLNADIAKSRA